MAVGDDALAQRSLAQGFHGYLAKPVAAPALMQAIEAANAVPAQAGATPARCRGDDAKVIERIRGRRILLVEDNEPNRSQRDCRLPKWARWRSTSA